MSLTESNSVDKANRLIQIRKLAKLNRSDMAEMASVSTSTYKGWENARFGGIPPRRASILAESLQTEGIKISPDWIINGTGDTPKKILFHQAAKFEEALADTTKNKSPEEIEELRIKAELEFFCNNNNWETISLTVPDDAMAPYFIPNDVVAGIKISQENFERTLGLNCIVRTKNNKILLRQIQKGKTKNHFTLLNLNSDSKQQPIIHEIELIDIAPVIWLRKKAIEISKIYCKKQSYQKK